MKLICAVVHETGSTFDVDIDEGATVYALKDAIKARNEDIKTLVRQLRLLLARKMKKASDMDGGEEDWLTQREAQKGVGDISGYDWLEYPDAKLQVVGLAIDQLGEVSDEDVAVGLGHVHVLVVVPEQKQPQPRLWRVSASIESALKTRGIRSRLYQLLGAYIGYYDPARCTDDKDIALWYEDKTLCVHSLFKAEENALKFDNALHDESITILSPLRGHAVRTAVVPLYKECGALRRIYGSHYELNDIDSSEDSEAWYSNISLVDMETDEFKYQSIESESWFGPMGKALSSPVIPREHCSEYPTHNKYANDGNNCLALSPDMYCWYNGLSAVLSVMNISIGDISDIRDSGYGNRYKRIIGGAVCSCDRWRIRKVDLDEVEGRLRSV